MSISALTSAAPQTASVAGLLPSPSVPTSKAPAPSSPAVINAVKVLGVPNNAGFGAAGAQSAVNGQNGLMQAFNHMDWAGFAKEDGVSVAAAGQQQFLRSLQLGESSIVADASIQGISNVDFTFDKPDASILLPYSPANGAAAVIAPPTNALTSARPASTPTSKVTVAVSNFPTNLSSGLVGLASSDLPGTSGTRGLNVSASSQSSGASVALALLEGLSSSNRIPTSHASAAQKHDFYV